MRYSGYSDGKSAAAYLWVKCEEVKIGGVKKMREKLRWKKIEREKNRKGGIFFTLF